jgi:hypothetical protein
MSDTLRIHVERTVRPVRAELRRKLQMREELYAALQAIFDDERRRQPSDEAAAAAAISRFGPAESLTAELQATVPRLARWACLFESLLRQRPGESVWRHALRIGLVYLSFMVAVLTETWAIALPVRGWDAVGESGVLTVMLLPIMSLGAVVFVLMGRVFTHGLSRMHSGAGGWLTMLAGATGVLSYVLTAGVMTVLAASRDLEAARDFLGTMSPTAAAAVVLHCIVVILLHRERLRIAPWEELDLSPAA